MSIILDAIKRAEETSKETNAPAVNTKPAITGKTGRSKAILWLGIPAAVLVFSLSLFFMPYLNKNKPADPALDSAALPGGQVPASGDTFHYTTESVPNMFPIASEPVSDLRFEGIIQGNGEPLAIIDGKLAAKGDKIGGFTLLEIRKDGVKLSDDSDSSNIIELKIQ